MKPVITRCSLTVITLYLLSAGVCACSLKPPEQVNFSVKGSMGKDQAPKLEYSIDTHPIGDIEADVSKAQSKKVKEASKTKESTKVVEAKVPPINFGNTLAFKRGRYLPQTNPNRDSSLNNNGSNSNTASGYSQDRLARAAVIKSYAPVQVVPIGLDAFCKTAWMNGLLHVRVALLGPENNVKTFLQDYPNMVVTFRDEAGNPLSEYTIPASVFKKADVNTNYGTPTFEYEGQVAMPLEAYEQFWQWTLEWQ